MTLTRSQRGFIRRLLAAAAAWQVESGDYQIGRVPYAAAVVDPLIDAGIVVRYQSSTHAGEVLYRLADTKAARQLLVTDDSSYWRQTRYAMYESFADPAAPHWHTYGTLAKAKRAIESGEVKPGTRLIGGAFTGEILTYRKMRDRGLI